MHVESVACEHDAGDVLSYVMHISFYGRYHHFWFVLCRAFILHEWLQYRYGIPHHLGRLHDLREEHLSLSEHSSDCLHSFHQRAFDDLQSLAISVHGLPEVGLEVLGLSLDESIHEPFFE